MPEVCIELWSKVRKNGHCTLPHHSLNIKEHGYEYAKPRLEQIKNTFFGQIWYFDLCKVHFFFFWLVFKLPVSNLYICIIKIIVSCEFNFKPNQPKCAKNGTRIFFCFMVLMPQCCQTSLMLVFSRQKTAPPGGLLPNNIT